ncbi:MAG: hypothetical protein R3B09_04585 [Nannocystaceae bacterium]
MSTHHTPDPRAIRAALAAAEIQPTDRAVLIACECQLFRGVLLAEPRHLVFLSRRFGEWAVDVRVQGPAAVAAWVAPSFGSPSSELRVDVRGHLLRFRDLDEADAKNIVLVVRGVPIAAQRRPSGAPVRRSPPPPPPRPPSPPPAPAQRSPPPLPPRR